MNEDFNTARMYRVFMFILSMLLIHNHLRAQSALEIVRKADENMRGKTSMAELVIMILSF